MPKGVPYRVHVAGKWFPPCTFTEIADGTGLSLSLISLIFNQKRPVTPYSASRLADFFGVSIEELLTPGVVNVQTPQPRSPGRVVARIPRGSVLR